MFFICLFYRGVLCRPSVLGQDRKVHVAWCCRHTRHGAYEDGIPAALGLAASKSIWQISMCVALPTQIRKYSVRLIEDAP